MKVMMTGGGTGGHVNPALAIAGNIKQNQPDAEIIFVGTSHGIENKLVPKEGYKLEHVEVQGFKRKLTPYNIKSAWLAFTSPLKAKKLLKEYKPDLVVGQLAGTSRGLSSKPPRLWEYQQQYTNQTPFRASPSGCLRRSSTGST